MVFLLFDDEQVKRALSLEEEGINWLHWIIHEFRSALQKRKDQLPSRAVAPGSAKFYLVKSPPKPHYMLYAIDQRRQFSALVDKLANNSKPRIGTISVQTIKHDDFELFRTDGTLSEEKGFYQYWLGLDTIIRNIDKDRRKKIAQQVLDDLADRSSNSNQSRRSDSRRDDKWSSYRKDKSDYGHFHYRH